MLGRLGKTISPRVNIINSGEHVVIIPKRCKFSSIASLPAMPIIPKLATRRDSLFRPISFRQFVTSKPETENGSTEVDLSPEEGETSEFTIQLTDQELEEITNGDPELVKKVKYIQLEHEVYKQEGIRVPSKIKMKNWKELLDLSSPGARKKYYNFLFINEMKALNDKRRKEQKREERMKEWEETGTIWTERIDDPQGMTYGLSRNTLFLRLYDSKVARFYHNRMAQALKFSRPLVLDCGYDEFMTHREAKNCAKQIEIMITQNRVHPQPYDLHLCNANKDSKILQNLSKIIPTLYDDDYVINIHEQSYLDVLPRKELIYLSPHAHDELEEYEEDKIYIIGAMVDKSDPRPFSLAKGKREQLPLKKLPLDKYLIWGTGNKSLTINQMVAIMLDLRYTNDWKAALSHVPMRKLNRDFHPYPDQNGDQNGGEEYPSIQQQQSQRRENRSQVLQDFDQVNRRKGYKSFDGPTNKQRYQVRNNYMRDDRENRSSRINVRSLLDD